MPIQKEVVSPSIMDTISLQSQQQQQPQSRKTYEIVDNDTTCSPNPCPDIGSTCIPIDNMPFCKCFGEHEFFPLGTKRCSSTTIMDTDNNNNKDDPNRGDDKTVDVATVSEPMGIHGNTMSSTMKGRDYNHGNTKGTYRTSNAGPRSNNNNDNRDNSNHKTPQRPQQQQQQYETTTSVETGSNGSGGANLDASSSSSSNNNTTTTAAASSSTTTTITTVSSKQPPITTQSIPFMDSNWTGEILEDACFPENPCEDNRVCVSHPLDAEDDDDEEALCHCPDTSVFVRLDVNCPELDNDMCDYSLDQEPQNNDNDTSCYTYSTNHFEMPNQCINYHGEMYCDCNDNGIFRLPCPTDFALGPLHYVGIGLVVVMVLFGLFLCRKKPPSNTGNNSKDDKNYQKVQGDDDEESTPDLKMKDEYQQLVTSHRTYVAVFKARIMVIIAVALWGTELGMIQRIEDYMPIGLALVLRFGFAVVLTLLCCFISPKPRLDDDETNNKKDKPTAFQRWFAYFRGLESGAWFGIGIVFQALALQSVSDRIVDCIIGGFGVLFVLFLDTIICRKVWFRQWLSAIVAAGGVTILTIYGQVYYLIPPTGLQLFYAFLAPVGFTMAFWRMGHAAEKYPNQSFPMTAAQMQSIFLICILYFVISEEAPKLSTFPWSDWSSNRELWFYLLWTGIVSIMIPNLFINYALSTLTSAETSILYTMEQVFAELYLVIYYGAPFFQWDFILGTTLIVLACLIATTVPPYWEQGKRT